MTDAPSFGTLTHTTWVRWPRAASQRSWSAGALVTDGYWLGGLPRVGGVLPIAAVLLGLALPIVRPGFETSVTEALPVLLAMVTIGVLSGHLGVALMVGFGVAELLRPDVPWRAELSRRATEEGGWLADPWLVGLIYERGPLVVHVAVVALLVVGVPMAGRQLAQSIAVHLRGRRWVDLGVATLLVALASGVVANLWASAAPQMVRPLWVFVPPWDRVPTVPVEAISPLQEQNRIIAGVVVGAVLLRALLVWWLSSAGSRRGALVAEIERELLAPLDHDPVPGWRRDLLSALAAGVIGALVVAGMIDDAWVFAVVAAVMVVTSLTRSGRLPLPTVAFRRAVTRIPVVARFGVGLLVVQGMVNATIGTERPTGSSFQFLVWPLLAGVVVLAVLLPRPPMPASPSHGGGGDGTAGSGQGGGRGPSSARFGVTGMLRSAVVVAVLVGWISVVTDAPAAAHNCQDLSDCFRTADALVSGITGMVVILGLVALSLSPWGIALGVAEGITGRDLLTGEELSAGWRVAGLLSFARLGRLGRMGRGLGRGGPVRPSAGGLPGRPTPRPPRRPTPPPPTPPPPRRWTRTDHQGTRVYQRSDWIDPGRVDQMGRTNVERMRRGLAPLGPDGKPMNLHHMLQTHHGPIAELTQTFHQRHSRVIHINPSSVPSGIDRAAFNRWRRSYWQGRAQDFGGPP